MASVEVGQKAIDFDIADHKGARFSLADFRGQKHVYLVFNRGFA